MASRAVEEAVDTALAEWAAAYSPAITVLTENTEPEAPADGSPFLIVQYLIENTSRPTISRGVYVEEGVFRVIINVARGEGTAAMRSMGSEIGALFRDVTLENGVECLIPRGASTNDESDSGNFLKGSVAVNYRYVYNA